MTKSIVYYTRNKVNFKLGHKCRKQILKANLPIVSVSSRPTNFGKNFVLNIGGGYRHIYEFKKDMYSKFIVASKKHRVYLKRLDKDKNFNKENCYWSSMKKDVNSINQFCITNKFKRYAVDKLLKK